MSTQGGGVRLMDMHLRVWSLNYRHPSRAEAYAETLLSMALQEPVRPQWPLPGGVADFAIPTAGIILEIDDKSHKAKRDKDLAKRAKWEKDGWLVVSCSDLPQEIVVAVAKIRALVMSLPVAAIEHDSKQILGGRIVLRGDHYKNLAAKRKAKKERKLEREASKEAKSKAGASSPRPKAAKRKAAAG